MKWISVNEKKPIESDGQILITNGNGLCEIVWVCDKDEDNDGNPSLKKPFAYDRHDNPCHRLDTFTYWMPLPKSPTELQEDKRSVATKA